MDLRRGLARYSIEGAALAGVACAMQLALTGFLLSRQPGVGASDAELARWFVDPSNRETVLIGLNFAPIGAVSFLWFIAVIRKRIGDREDRFFATVFFGSGLTFAILAVTSAVAAAAPTLVVQYGGVVSPDRQTIALAHGLWFGLYVVGGSRFAAVFMFVTSTVGTKFGAFPRWLSIFGYIVAVVLFVAGGFSGSLDFLFVVWLLVVSLTLLVRRHATIDGTGPE
jgi:hypothetical protein